MVFFVILQSNSQFDLAQQFPEWIAGKKYNPYDKCTYKGKFWECNELHVSEEKFQESKWVELGNIIDETTGEAIPIYGVWREDNEKEGPTCTMLGVWAGTSSCHMTAQTLTYNTPQQGSISLANSAVSTSLVAPFSKDLGRLYCRIMARKISTGGATSPWGRLGRIYFTNYLDSDWSMARWMDIDTNLYEVQAYNSIDGTGTNLWQGATVEPAYGTTPYAGYTANHTYATDGDTSTSPAVRSTNADYQGTIGTWYATTSVATPVDVKSIRIHYGTAAKTQVAVRTGTGKNLFNGEFSYIMIIVFAIVGLVCNFIRFFGINSCLKESSRIQISENKSFMRVKNNFLDKLEKHQGDMNDVDVHNLVDNLWIKCV